MSALDLQLVLDAQHSVTAAAWSQALAIFFARWAIFLNLGLGLILIVSRVKRARHAVLEVAWSVAVSALFVALIAFMVQRPRPFMAASGVVALIPPPISTAFPSGHTSVAVAMAIAFAHADPRIGLISCVIAGLVAFGRISAGVHYPTDILGGVLVGLASFGVVRVIHAQLKRRDVARSARQHQHE